MTTTSRPWRIDSGKAGVLSPGRWFWARIVVWTVSLFGLAIGGLFVSLRLSSWLPIFARHDTAVALIIPAATLFVYALAVRIGECRPASELSLARAPLELAAGAAVGFAFISLALLLLWALGLYEIHWGHWRDAGHYFVFNAYISGVIEELAFRAILLRLLARMFRPLAGLLLSAALFGLAHASHASTIAILELIVNGGVFLGLLYAVSGRLWLAIGAHVAYDFTEWSLMGIGDRDGLLAVSPATHFPDWLTGGTFGPDGSLLTALVGALLTWSILLLRRRFPG